MKLFGKYVMFGFFYYSEKAAQTRRRYEETYMNYMRPLFGGKARPYTEMRSTWNFLPTGPWDDYRFVGIGFWDSHKK